MRVEAGWVRILSAVGAAAMLASCGGGDGTDTSAAAGPLAAAAAPELRGVVVDGAGEGTQVFLDLNGNQSREDDEPQALAGADGSFALPVPPLSVGQLASAMLVAQASGAKTLMAPAASYIRPDGAGVSGEAVISPLTTLVAAEVAFNGMTPEEARQSVDAQKQLGGKDPMANYAATRDSQLGSIARAAPGAELLAPAPRGRKAPAPEGYTRMIVKLDDTVEEPMDVAGTLAAAYGAQVSHAYRRAVKGFAIEVPDNSVAAFVDTLQADPRVDSVEEDQVASGGAILQSNVTWGLDRVDQRVLPLTGSYSYAGNGSGVRAYIIDSGLRSTHSEFTGRVQSGFTAVGSSTNDCHGHGTHVAGTVGGSTWGMAKGVTIVPVRVLDCDNRGTISGIIAGIDWVVANARLPAVANLSITADSLSSSLDAAVERAVAAGITMAVAAGNAGTNSCNVSPARAPGALTVGATNSSDLKPSWSNYGTCLDVFAPGQDIKSAYYTSDTATYTMWGTSMATPHVAGLAAIMLQQNAALTPAQVATNIKAAATLNAIGSIGSGSPNVMLYASTAATEPVVTPPPPTTTTTALSVASLTGNTFVDGRRYWTARVIVAVKDASGALVPGVVAKGNFTAGGTGKSCTTASNGTCTITSSRIGSTTALTTFTIGALTKTGATYAASSNVKSSLMLGRPDGTADTAKR